MAAHMEAAGQTETAMSDRLLPTKLLGSFLTVLIGLVVIDFLLDDPLGDDFGFALVVAGAAGVGMRMSTSRIRRWWVRHRPGG